MSSNPEIIKSFKSYLNEIKEKVNKCDNNIPYLAADLMETIQDNVFSLRKLSPKEGFDIRHELYEILKDYKNCKCR